MHTVDLADRVLIRPSRASTVIRLSCKNASVPQGRDNIVYRAAELVLTQAGVKIGLEIDVDKHIPIGGGLGGGSSDAAATIFGLVRLLALDWPLEDMAKLGAQLGSDVAFFFCAPSALVCEWGQTVFPLSIAGERWIVLANPGFPIGTKWAYECVSSIRGKVRPIGQPLHEIQVNKKTAWEELVRLMENDFEPALFPVFPELEHLRGELLAAGAQAALLSGSGATMFGVFTDEGAARQAKDALARDPRRQVVAAKSESTSFWTQIPYAG